MSSTSADTILHPQTRALEHAADLPGIRPDDLRARLPPVRRGASSVHRGTRPVRPPRSVRRPRHRRGRVHQPPGHRRVPGRPPSTWSTGCCDSWRTATAGQRRRPLPHRARPAVGPRRPPLHREAGAAAPVLRRRAMRATAYRPLRPRRPDPRPGRRIRPAGLPPPPQARGFRPGAVGELARRPDRGEYDLPDELLKLEVLEVGRAFLPCYAIRAHDGQRRRSSTPASLSCGTITWRTSSTPGRQPRT